MTFDMALSTMKSDFRTMESLIQHPILIARGPVLSWMAQFYLESLPLSGLIMIDPIPFTTERAYALYHQTHYHTNADSSSNTSIGTNGMTLSKEYHDIIQDYSEHWDHWTLKIEAGSIPMLILSTKVSESMTMMMDDDDLVGGGGSDRNFDMDDELQFSGSGGGITEPTDVEDTFAWREFAEQTAQRHSGGSTTTNTSTTGRSALDETTTNQQTSNHPMIVPVIDIDAYNIKHCSTVIHDWINDKVL